MGLDPQEGFTESNKVGDVHNRIWHELVKLHAVNKEKPTKKFVGRKRKTTEEESKKHHPITARGLGDAFGTGEDDLLPSDEELFPLSLGHIGFFEFQGHLAGRRVPALLLRHLFLVRNSLYGHLEEVRSEATRKLRSARKMQQWWRQKNKELVNSKNQSHPLIKLPMKGTWAKTWRKKRKP
jgi:L-rhamnose mutarotase